MTRAICMFVVAAVLASGCRTVPGAEDPEPRSGADGLPADLGAVPRPLEPAAAEAPPDAGGGERGRSDPAAGSDSRPPAADGPRAFATLAAVDDPSGDAALLDAPEYADLVVVTLEDDGANARVTVEMAGPIPERLGSEDEVMGVGVDLYADREAPESDYQLFADGGGEGWRAYLQTPDGFVRYPGSFFLGGTRVVFEVPWSSLGDLRGEALSAFADWSGPGPVLPESSSDRAPDGGREPFER